MREILESEIAEALPSTLHPRRGIAILTPASFLLHHS